MTLMLWNGREFGVDRQYTKGSKFGEMDKIRVSYDEQGNGFVWASCGDVAAAHEFEQWFTAGANDDEYKPERFKNSATLLVAFKGKKYNVLEYNDSPHPVTYPYEKCLALGQFDDTAEALADFKVPMLKIFKYISKRCISVGVGVDIFDTWTGKLKRYKI